MSILQLKKSNCKNCYKCIRNCPVKSIEIKEHQAQIIDNDCVLCGKCILNCPQNAKQIRNDTSVVKNLIREGKKVIATVAPSFISTYEVSGFEEFKAYLKRLGFYDAYETAEGAFLVKGQYEKLVEQRWSDTIISSCCPTVAKLIQKHYPSMIKHFAPVLSPMQVSSKLIKERHPECKVIFIGPCISKKDECECYSGITDYALTFEELREWFEEKEMQPLNNDLGDEVKYISRFFPITGGIIKTMAADTEYNYITVDDIENCISVFKEIEEGKLKNCFIEMSACKGSCVNGPLTGKSKVALISNQIRIKDFSLDKKKPLDFDIKSSFDLDKQFKNEQIIYNLPDESQISAILKQIGKNRLEDELNCGTCGYSTCRDKAIAVYFGKADISMCLPYMKERAESFSDKIISATPNAIITVDSSLNIQQINNSACKIFGIQNPRDIIGAPVSRIMDEFDFVNAFASEEHTKSHKKYLAEYKKYIEQIFVYDKCNNIVICIMKDITENELKREKINKAKNDSVNITDRIIEKQMRIVHEIASLLGETTAETKVALTELKSTILMEENEE